MLLKPLTMALSLAVLSLSIPAIDAKAQTFKAIERTDQVIERPHTIRPRTRLSEPDIHSPGVHMRDIQKPDIQMIGTAGTELAQAVDVKIVLAVDASGSINRAELQLQLDGISAAFRDQDILRAVTSGPFRQISVALLVWSDAAYRKIPTKWHIVKDRATADAFSDVVELFAKDFGGVFSVVGGGTGIGDALAYALNMIANAKEKATKHIVDISGDGVETPPWSKGAIELPQARQRARMQGVMVNGLAILNDNPNLDAWYRRNLIVGRGSFVMKVALLKDYRKAIRKKLLRELQTHVIGAAPDTLAPHRQIHRLAQATPRPGQRAASPAKIID